MVDWEGGPSSGAIVLFLVKELCIAFSHREVVLITIKKLYVPVLNLPAPQWSVNSCCCGTETFSNIFSFLFCTFIKGLKTSKKYGK